MKIKAQIEPDYLVRRDKPGTFIVTKWEGGEQPSAIYNVTETNRGLSCNCPGSFRDKNCKHIQLVKEHMKDKTSESEYSYNHNVINFKGPLHQMGILKYRKGAQEVFISRGKEYSFSEMVDKVCSYTGLDEKEVVKALKGGKASTYAAIGNWSQDGRMSSLTEVMKDGPMVKALIFDNSNPQNKNLSKPNEIVVEVHFDDKKPIEARDFSWKNTEVLKSLIGELATNLRKSPPQDETSLMRSLKNTTSKNITEASDKELNNFLKENGVEITGKKIKLSDAEKVTKLIGKFYSKQYSEAWKAGEAELRKVMKENDIKVVKDYLGSFTASHDVLSIRISMDDKSHDSGYRLPNGKVTVNVYSGSKPTDGINKVSPERAAKFIKKL